MSSKLDRKVIETNIWRREREKKERCHGWTILSKKLGDEDITLYNNNVMLQWCWRRENPIRCGNWCTVLWRDGLALLKMYPSAQLIKMSSVQALHVQGKYPNGIYFFWHVDPPCRHFCSRWLFSDCHWLPTMLHKHLVLFHLIRLEGFH